jgi:hypothetical protein
MQAEIAETIEVIKPDGRFLFHLVELAPYIRRDGLLGQFIR